MQRVFRPTRRYWFNEVVSPALFLAGLALFFLFLNGKTGATLAIFFGLIALLFLPTALQTARTRLEIDERRMHGLYRKRPFDYPWSEVRALRRVMAAGSLFRVMLDHHTRTSSIICHAADADRSA